MRTTTKGMARGAFALAIVVLLGYLAASTGAQAQLVDDPKPTPTTQAPAPTTTAPPKSPSTTEPPAVGGNDDGAVTTGTIPPGYDKIIASVKRSRANNTHALVAALQPLVDRGLTAAQVAVAGFGHFPVGGPANFTDDWLNPRFTPRFHLHEGTDIFAPTGTPVRSPVEGVVRHNNGLGAGGIAAYVTTKEGHELYFAHLASYSDVKPGDSVKVGTVLGYVGDTGNARGGAPHLHFEIHPKGRGPVNPKPYLDQWVAQALASAPQVIAALSGAAPQEAAAAPAVSEPLTSVIERVTPPRAQLAWASSANPTGGALRLAEVEAAVASLRVDWNERARLAEAQRLEAEEADLAAKAVLRPLTPRGLYDVLGLR